MAKNVTFRTQLLGGVAEFCHSTGLPILGNALHLVELIVLLARYQEEGVRLRPETYLTNKIGTLCSMLPDRDRVKIGDSPPDVSGIKEALKKCAPLATGGWLIYIQSDADKIEYGVFKGSSNPISVLVDDVVMTPNNDLIVVKAFQVAEECVEVRANNGSLHYIFLDHREEESPPPLQYLDKLVSTIIDRAEVEVEYIEPATSFLTRLLFEALRESHGCIVAVTNMKKPPKLLSTDGVILDEPIDFVRLVRDLSKDRIQPSYIASKGHLLKGMLNSDGITLFDNRGRLLGYNCFIKLSTRDHLIGGARKRAFVTLAERIGRGLGAVFMQSQDGRSDFRESPDE